MFLFITCIIQKQEKSLYLLIHFPPLSLVFSSYVSAGIKLLLKGGGNKGVSTEHWNTVLHCLLDCA